MCREHNKREFHANNDPQGQIDPEDDQVPANIPISIPESIIQNPDPVEINPELATRFETNEYTSDRYNTSLLNHDEYKKLAIYNFLSEADDPINHRNFYKKVWELVLTCKLTP